MAHFFNIAGPCVAAKHYMLPPEERIHGVKRLIDRDQYFVIHAPRQSGKTTFLQHLGKKINREKERLALYASLERVEGLNTRQEAIPAIIKCIGDAAIDKAAFLLDDEMVNASAQEDESIALGRFLRNWCSCLSKPLVLLIDEADCLSEDALISFLRQLRDGYVNRPTASFPSSIALVGMHNLRDYRTRIRPERETLGSTSPFNIIAEALTLRDFTRDEIAALYAQHTEEIGQVFQAAAVDLVYELTNGQPWLVNALALHCVDELVPDPANPITKEHIESAKEALIQKKPAHLDSLMERLRERRVQKIIEPILAGRKLEVDPNTDDYLFVTDLGLIREENGRTVISNAIYRELIPRYLNAITQQDSDLPGANAFLVPDGSVNMLELLQTFQQFWRENSEIWIDRYTYREAGPHLVLQAYLQRIFNGAGAILREYAAGTGRVDLCVRRGKQRYAIELKSVRPYQSLQKVQTKGLDQLADYLDRLGLTEGCLLIFDQRPDLSWEERIYEKTFPHKGKNITVFGA